MPDQERKVVRGRAFAVPNNNRKFGQDPEYINIWVQLPGSNKDVPLLFTEEDIERAAKRAEGNEEDIYVRSQYYPIGFIEPQPLDAGAAVAGPDLGSQHSNDTWEENS